MKKLLAGLGFLGMLALPLTSDAAVLDRFLKSPRCLEAAGGRCGPRLRVC